MVLAAIAPSDTLKAAFETANQYAAMAMSSNTVRAFESDWRDFERWCLSERIAPYPATPQIVGAYLARLAQTRKLSTLQRRLAAIAWVHRNRGHFYSPASMRYSAVCNVVNGLKRTMGTRPDQKAALTTDQLRAIVCALPESPQGFRNKALLLMGFASGLRRSELVALKMANVEETPDGLKVLIGRSKADQEGEGRTVGIPYGSDPRTCPVRAYRTWLTASGITEGPIFRHYHGKKMGQKAITAQVVALVVKYAAERAGLDPAALAGHSLRSGLATQAARNCASERSIMRQTGHRSVTMVRRYIHEGELFHDNAAAKLGL